MPHKSLPLWEKLAWARYDVLRAGLWDSYNFSLFEKKLIEASGSTKLIPKKA